ncbi:SOS response-associated peptidase [Balneola sp. MJW-20]|uniref:SOS response-associated peptidase n=1 Tax=Gracilimonas aurantiaca TaxID=3234185 RepID=UPI0034670716
MNRFALYAEREEIEDQFNAKGDSPTLFKKRYNILKGQTITVIIKSGKQNKVVSANWGLSLNEGTAPQASLRIEEITEEGPAWDLLKDQVCIIPINGFYQWKEQLKDDPYPFFIRLITEEVTGVAGILKKEITESGAERLTCVALTMRSNPLISPLSDQMPVLLKQNESLNWLAGNAREMVKKGFDGSRFLTDMTVFRVPELVNDPSQDSPELIQPIPKLRDDD